MNVGHITPYRTYVGQEREEFQKSRATRRRKVHSLRKHATYEREKMGKFRKHSQLWLEKKKNSANTHACERLNRRVSAAALYIGGEGGTVRRNSGPL